ncbi:hypothetical protein ACFLW7_04855, partial [Chloroflexota bacterium]
GEHGAEPDADFVYRSWLEARGEFSVVKAGAIQWLRLNHDKEEAVFPRSSSPGSQTYRSRR